MCMNAEGLLCVVAGLHEWISKWMIELSDKEQAAGIRQAAPLAHGIWCVTCGVPVKWWRVTWCDVKRECKLDEVLDNNVSELVCVAVVIEI